MTALDEVMTATHANVVAAEAAAKAAEDAQKAAEEEKLVAEEAALNGTKYQAALNLDTYAERVDKSDYIKEQIEALADIVSDVKAAIAAAESLEEVRELLDEAKAQIDAIEDMCPSSENQVETRETKTTCFDKSSFVIQLPIQIPNAKVQVRSKGEPKQIRDLKFGSKRIYLVKYKDHPQNQDP